MTSSLQTKERGQTIQKGSVLKVWKPYRVIPIPSEENGCSFQDLPRYESCDVWDQAIYQFRISIRKDDDLNRFVTKLAQEASFEALCVLSVLELASFSNEKDWNRILQLMGKKEKTTTNIEGDEDDDNLLLVEGWPLMQDSIPWNCAQSLYQEVKSHLHQVTLPHPLSHYATKTLLELSQEDFDRAIQLAHSKNWIPKQTQNRLQASQFFLDLVATLPPRIVGVLMWDPIFGYKHEEQILQQSCTPNVSLELSIDNKDPRKSIVCSSIAIYDIEPYEDSFVSTIPSSRRCQCLKCKYDRGQQIVVDSNSAAHARRVAHSYFQQGEYDEASNLYRKCYDAITDHDESAAADLWHSMAAVELSRSNFVKAQELWEEGSRYETLHSGIALQLEKQRAYRYLGPVTATNQKANDGAVPEYRTTGSASSPSSCVFVTENMVSDNYCRQLLEWAEEHASNGGWTSARHYAVPTIDIPVHKSPRLLDWFTEWMEREMMMLLQAQFQTNKRFFVHDAFLVRYDACKSSRFLPLHFDESTHSFVLALNDEFEGGGTYFYALDKTIAPKAGSVVTFRGDKMLHGGNCVTKGVRYILAVFLFADSDNVANSVTRDCGDEADHSSPSIGTKRQKTSQESFSFSFF